MQTTDVYKVVVNASGQNVSYDICNVCVCVSESVCVFFLMNCCSTCRKKGRLTEVSYLSTALLYCVNLEKCICRNTLD